MTGPGWRAEDLGTAFDQARPWLRAIDDLVESARAVLDGTGSDAELARKLGEYDAAARKIGDPGGP